MANSRSALFTNAQVRAAVESYQRHGSYEKAGRELGMDRRQVRHLVVEVAPRNLTVEAQKARIGTVRDDLNRLVEMIRQQGPVTQNEWEARGRSPQPYRYEPVFGSWAAFHAAGMVLAGHDFAAVRDLRRLANLEREAREARAEARRAHEEAATLLAEHRWLQALHAETIEIPDWEPTLRTGKGRVETPILFASDWQWGEVINRAGMGGLGEFNSEIAAQRVELLGEKAISLAFEHRGQKRYAPLIYIRGGDMISGEIHADLRESNDLQAAAAVRDLVTHEAAMLKMLAKAFGNVVVVSVPGNHGRLTPKPQSKRGALENMDSLSGLWLSDIFAGDKRFTFHVPASGDAVLDVQGWRFGITHGDRTGSSGGQGFIGVAATIIRGMKKVHEMYSTVGKPLDYILMGHYHTSLKLEHGFSNGCLPGYSEFARDFRMRPGPPCQWLLFVDAEHGVNDFKEVLLGPKPRLTQDTNYPAQDN